MLGKERSELSHWRRTNLRAILGGLLVAGAVLGATEIFDLPKIPSLTLAALGTTAVVVAPIAVEAIGERRSRQ
ncbi:MAG TPA: hypothetical protein VLG37_00620 [Candidatus Saccharimonadales bacterium]|nr:hypothetical protein [Candidatus Saccharimonadales bacterium]